MGNKPDWVGKSFKKSEILKLADGTESIPELPQTDVPDFDPGFDINYVAEGMSAKNLGGGGRISRNVYSGEDGTLNLGVSGSHWKGGGKSGVELQGLDASYRTKEGDYGIQYEPKAKRVQVTFRKEF